MRLILRSATFALMLLALGAASATAQSVHHQALGLAEHNGFPATAPAEYLSTSITVTPLEWTAGEPKPATTPGGPLNRDNAAAPFYWANQFALAASSDGRPGDAYYRTNSGYMGIQPGRRLDPGSPESPGLDGWRRLALFAMWDGRSPTLYPGYSYTPATDRFPVTAAQGLAPNTTCYSTPDGDSGGTCHTRFFWQRNHSYVLTVERKNYEAEKNADGSDKLIAHVDRNKLWGDTVTTVQIPARGWWWQATITDKTTGVSTPIARIRVDNNQTLATPATSFTEYFGWDPDGTAVQPDFCSQMPYALARWDNPVMTDGTGQDVHTDYSSDEWSYEGWCDNSRTIRNSYYDQDLGWVDGHDHYLDQHSNVVTRFYTGQARICGITSAPAFVGDWRDLWGDYDIPTDAEDPPAYLRDGTAGTVVPYQGSREYNVFKTQAGDEYKVELQHECTVRP